MTVRPDKQLLGLVRRHLFVTVLLVLVLVLRVLLPEVLRSVLATQASEMIEGRVEIGDLDLWFLRGAVALQDVAVFPTDDKAGAVIGWKDLYVNVRWISLPGRVLRLSEIRIEEPRVDAKRLVNGDLNLAKLVRNTSEGDESEPEDESEDGGSWTVAVDRFLLHGGDLGFHDLAVASPDPVEVEIVRFELAKTSLRRDTYEEPGQVDFEARIEGAPLRLQAKVELDPTIRIVTNLELKGLSLNRGRRYLPMMGWSGLRGKLDLTLAHHLEVGQLNKLSGSAALRDLAVEVEGLDRPALAWQSLAVRVDDVDLMEQRVAVAEVKLQDPTVALTPRLKLVFPLLGGAGNDAAPKSVENEPSESSEAPGVPWAWSVGQVAVEGGHLLVLGADAPVDIGVRVAAERVKPGDASWPVELAVVDGSASLTVAGSVRLEPIGFAGKVKWQELQIPRLAEASGLVLPVEVRSGQLAGELEIVAAMDTPEAATGTTDVHVRGTAEVSELELSEGAADQFTVSWKRFAVDMASLLLPGILGGGNVEPAVRPIAVRLNAVELEKPRVRLTRTASGLVLPSSASTEGSGGPDEKTAKGEEAPTPHDDAGESAAPLRAEIASVELADGQVTFVDQTLTPAGRQRLTNIQLKARGIAWPDRRVEELSLDMKGPGDAQLNVKGTGQTGATDLEIVLERLGLERFDPYASAHAGYGITGGSASLTSKVALTTTTYDSQNQLVLHKFAVSGGGGETAFSDRFGVPLTVALALMKDAKGNISLDVPIRGERTGTKLGLTTAVTSAMRQAIVSTLSSPLKLVGAIDFREGKVEGLGVNAVSFQAGSDEPDEAGLEQLEQLGELLSARPALALRLEGTVGDADERDAEEGRELAKTRVEKARAILGETHGIDPERLEVVPPSGEVTKEVGGVRVEIDVPSN